MPPSARRLAWLRVWAFGSIFRSSFSLHPSPVTSVAGHDLGYSGLHSPPVLGECLQSATQLVHCGHVSNNFALLMGEPDGVYQLCSRGGPFGVAELLPSAVVWQQSISGRGLGLPGAHSLTALRVVIVGLSDIAGFVEDTPSHNVQGHCSGLPQRRHISVKELIVVMFFLTFVLGLE